MTSWGVPVLGTACCHTSRAPRGFDGDYGGSPCSMGSEPVAQWADGPVMQFVRPGPKFKKAPWPQQLFALFPLKLFSPYHLSILATVLGVSFTWFTAIMSLANILIAMSPEAWFLYYAADTPRFLCSFCLNSRSGFIFGGFKGNKGSFSSGSL